TWFPKHYLQQFHIKYNSPENIAKLIADNNIQDYDNSGAVDWVDLFLKKGGRLATEKYADWSTWTNPDKPTLNAWRLTKSDIPNGFVEFERNPYYWKIDTDNQQLPYIDTVHFKVYADIPTLQKAALAGEIDMQDRFIAGSFNSPDDI